MSVAPLEQQDARRHPKVFFCSSKTPCVTGITCTKDRGKTVASRLLSPGSWTAGPTDSSRKEENEIAPNSVSRRTNIWKRWSLRGLPRAAALSGLWLVLTGGSTDTWYIGAVFVVAATLASLALLPDDRRGWRVSAGGALRFTLFFLKESLVGGADVALRALRPSLPLDPDIVDHTSRLPESHARVFAACVMSLLPGTLSAELDRRELRIHSLVGPEQARRNMDRLEARVADLFGLDLIEAGGRRR
ncbi:Na+/H+ ion antiporter subunit (plasmid) [Rubrobacter radiotolerans]|uniref:Na+/H+ ion antiporter subunit n=1 Tax=Rubrobacter radiotolerans TaxID=42256 RepID=A0A023X7C4_RUBRA|nr:Na+/H+ ion antiporter subunit [Rubrobacter radiotolerans]